MVLTLYFWYHILFFHLSILILLFSKNMKNKMIIVESFLIIYVKIGLGKLWIAEIEGECEEANQYRFVAVHSCQANW